MEKRCRASTDLRGNSRLREQLLSTFEQLRAIGAELISLHLMEHPGLDIAAPMMDGDDRGLITGFRYDPEEQSIRLGPNLIARSVIPAVWAFNQGAYPVVRKFLEEREGRVLESLEFEDFRHMVAAVALTIEVQPELDRLLAQAICDGFSSQELGLSAEV